MITLPQPRRRMCSTECSWVELQGTTARPPQNCHERQRLLIEILEIGFRSDTRWEEKVHKKMQQHEQLTLLLRKAGWRVAEPHVLFGTAGTYFERTFQSLRFFGFMHEDTHKCWNPEFLKVTFCSNIGITSCWSNPENAKRL